MWICLPGGMHINKGLLHMQALGDGCMSSSPHCGQVCPSFHLSPAMCFFHVIFLISLLTISNLLFFLVHCRSSVPGRSSKRAMPGVFLSLRPTAVAARIIYCRIITKTRRVAVLASSIYVSPSAMYVHSSLPVPSLRLSLIYRLRTVIAQQLPPVRNPWIKRVGWRDQLVIIFCLVFHYGKS